ncbi:hypothetical protein PoMZ_00031 [Pyricularia oryzae]|uniref:Uncharacterized protein n=1 Tax=Pyricularia oryzae TaxID=318829 RepID=A0A4P7MYR8_PYROR|nr:hypothetical protein PoMZ_00031 [Pyricularia oryzae]
MVSDIWSSGSRHTGSPAPNCQLRTAQPNAEPPAETLGQVGLVFFSAPRPLGIGQSDERLQAGTSKSTTAPSLLNDSCRLAWRAIILGGRLVRVVQNEGVVSRYEVRYDAVLVAAF